MIPLIPIEKFGKDHWSVLAYAEHVMVECGGFQVGFDGRMRQCRRHFRVMESECHRPKRPGRLSEAVVMDLKYSTRLKDGTTVEGHDDWHCIQDMVECGLLKGDVQPGEILHLTPLGHQVVSDLRAHKSNGGSFGDFTYEGIK